MNNQANINMQFAQQIDSVSVDVSAFNAKYQSKPEVFRFLASEAGVYIDDYQVVTTWHLKELASGHRRIILSKNAKHFFVPQFEDLDKDDMLRFAEQYSEAMRALPSVEHERRKLHRSYIANVIYTIVGEPFKAWADGIIESRNKNIKKEGNMNIDMDPQVFAAF